MDESLIIRVAARADIAAVDALLARSYPALLKADYPPSVLVTALPLISRAQPGLVTCGTYYVGDAGGKIVCAGGWTRAAPGQGGGDAGLGHIRHVVTDHRRTRQGHGRALMAHILKTAQAAGIRRMMCYSTRTAEPFYREMGFRALAPMEVTLRPGISFPAVRMECTLG